MEYHLFKPDWKKTLFKAWSSRILMLAGFLTCLESFVRIAWDHGLLDLPNWVYPVGMSVIVGCALVARLLAQKDFR